MSTTDAKKVVERGSWRRLRLIAAAVSISLVLAACAPQPSTASQTMDTEQATESLNAIDGVDDATVTFALNGFPGNYRSTTRLTVTADGDAALGEVLRQAASVIWAEYGTQVPQYRFAVEAPWPDGPEPLQKVMLKDRQAEFEFTQGKYLGTHLILTREELAAMFGAAE